MIFCFDLDGTLCYTEGMDYEAAVPIEDRIHYVNRLYDDGHTIIVQTARGSRSGEDWLFATVQQLDEWGLKFHEIDVGNKPAADFYVDDRSLHPDEFFPC